MFGKKLKLAVVFLGPPGSGKGTQADQFGAQYNLPVISPGELLRHEVAVRSRVGRAVSVLLAKGKLVPDALVEEVMAKRLAKRDCRSGFVLDGYPRRLAQLRHLKKHLAEVGIAADKVLAVYIHVSDKVIRQRVTGRLVCDCGASYHTLSNPPKTKGRCDSCGRKLERRPDDAPATVSKRLKDYHHRLMPIYRYLQKNHRLVRIEGEASIRQIQKEIQREYLSIIKNDK